jgi:putative membrane protein
MKHINKKEWKKTTKYIAGSTGAVALAVASCAAGITGTGTDVTKYDKEYLAGDDKASDTDATTIMNTDDLADQLADNVNLKEKDVDKDETVYVFAKANGDVDNILVNETLKNRDKNDKIEDTTDLKDIVNVKGDETFTQNGNKITWDAAGNEISYQGTTDKQLPVSVKATYYLDGNEISPEELAGKSGKVKIRLDYTSNEKVTKEVNGKEEDISVPFVAVSGMVLGDNFTNIQVTNGKYLAQGESNIVVGYAVPGLDSGVKDAAKDLDTEIPDYVEVSADVTDFSLDMTVTMLVNGSEMDYSGDLDLTDLDDLTEALSSAGNQLATGSGDLSDGATQVSDGAGTLADKMGDLTTGAGSLKTGMETLSSSSGDLASGVAVIDQSAQSIANGINTLDTAVNTKMTAEEQAAVAQQAGTAAASAVEAQFAPDSQTYAAIAAQAAQNFTSTMTSEDQVNAVAAALASNEDARAKLRPAVASAVAAQTAQGTIQYKIQYNLLDGNDPQAIATEFYNDYTNEYNSGISGTNKTVEDQITTALSAMAKPVLDGVASQGANTMGNQVANACKSAATQAASQAAGQAAVQGAETAKATIASQIEATQANGYSLVSGANALAQGTSTLAGSVPALKEGISQLVSGANALASGAGQLKDGAVTLADGASQVADGAGTLNESLVSLNNDAIKKMVNAYNGDVKDSVERLQAAMEAATEYDSFGGKSDNTAGVTKFIIKTAAISAE